MYEKKYKSITVIWGAILLMLQALALIDAVGLRPTLYDQLTKLQISFIAVAMIGLVTAYMILCLHKKKSGPILGMLIGVLYIMTLNIINTIAGMCFIIYCAWLLKELNISNKITEKEEEKEEKKEEENKNM